MTRLFTVDAIRRRRFYTIVGPEVEALIAQADDASEPREETRRRLLKRRRARA